jgi:hypothetical protein
MTSVPQGPLIPDSTNFAANYTRSLKCSSVMSDFITNGTISIMNGIITGISDPINGSDAANKQWSDAHMPGGIAALPLNSIQYSVMGQFTGSSSLTFVTNTSATVLISTDTLVIGTDGNLEISNGTITGLIDPVNDDNVLNKQFLQNYYKTIVVSDGSAGITYSTMANYNYYRSISASTTDTTATATEIIAELAALGRSFAYFKVRNTSTNYDNVLTITAGSGVIINPSGVNIFPGYELNAVITDDGVINIIGLNFFESGTEFVIGDRGLNLSAGITKITDQFSFNTSITTLSSKNVIYKPTTVQGIIYRNFAGEKVDSFDTVSSFISGFAYPNSVIDYIFSTGAVEVTIKNTSSTGAVTLVSSGSWTFDPVTIPIGKTGMFYMYVDTTSVTGSIYTIGIV